MKWNASLLWPLVAGAVLTAAGGCGQRTRCAGDAVPVTAAEPSPPRSAVAITSYFAEPVPDPAVAQPAAAEEERPTEHAAVAETTPKELELVPYVADGAAEPAQPAPPAAAAGPVPPAPRMGHAADYSWLTGELEYLYSRKIWTVRYAAVGADDRHGGRVELLNPGPTDRLRTGQLVRVEGRLDDPATRQVCPAYHVRALEPLAP